MDEIGVAHAYWVSPGFTVGAALVFGLLIGSFLNVVIHRLPRMLEAQWREQAAEINDQALPPSEPLNLVTPRSRCPHCGNAISALHNVPLVSWLMLRGRCAHCGAAISWRYPLVEAISGVLAAVAILHFGLTAAGVGAALLGFFLITLTFIDLDTQLLPDDITLPLLWIGLAFNLAATFVPLHDAVIGAMAGYLVLWTVFWLFKLVTGKEGMGYGDFKLLAALGAWFGWQAIPAIILLASAVGAAVGVAMIVFASHRRETPIPFGPYLAGAGLLALYFAQPLAALFAIR